MYKVYVLKSCKITRYYVGVTGDLDGRLIAHNRGSTKSTKPYRPWIVIYTESYQDIKDAYKREWHLKHPRGFVEKREIIKKFG